ncbi:hypothetical protein F1643_07850 [Azospirillum sp. INR13]|uniref:hypothetical protein n=1 Tax=Azospirillum sp. INR13 TaxID=2596919 RepID=UPI001892880B|nr:hypothetical protein [Azospirillum sp. INR13]MBF5094411.1 hypothetical protein [Azospirillum sp. INR13]
MSGLHDDEDDDFDDSIDVDESLDIDDDPYSEEETPLSELEPEELISIADQENISSGHIEPLKKDLSVRNSIQKKIDEAEQSSSQPLKDNLDQINTKIDDRIGDLIGDIEAQRDEILNPTYGADEISDDGR